MSSAVWFMERGVEVKRGRLRNVSSTGVTRSAIINPPTDGQQMTVLEPPRVLRERRSVWKAWVSEST